MIDISKFVRKSAGKFFTVTFVKRDGSIRKLNGRLGVGRAPVQSGKYFVVYDVKNMGFRHVRIDGIVSLTCEGVTILNNNVPEAVA